MNGNLSPWINSLEVWNQPMTHGFAGSIHQNAIDAYFGRPLSFAATSPRFRSFMLPVHEKVNWRMRYCGRSNARREGRVREPAEEPEQGGLGKGWEPHDLRRKQSGDGDGMRCVGGDRSSAAIKGGDFILSLH
jgi:hypothetical protein